MSEYLHGIDHEEKDAINLTISDADTSAIAVIGTKPTYLLETNNMIEKVTNFAESAKYCGNNIDGFTLPDACETILTESGGADIYTINIFDYEKHSANVDKSITFANGICELKETGIQNLTVKKGENPLTEGEDYSFENNIITILPGGQLETSQDDTSAAYDYVDLTKITDADIIGSTDANDSRTGIQAIWDIISTYGIIPGIIIAPGFSSKNVRTALESIAEEIKSFAYTDIPEDTALTVLEKARLNPQEVGEKTIDLTTSSEFSMMCEPYLYRYNSYQNTDSYKPASPVVAGLRVKMDREKTVAKSIDNTLTKTTKGRKFNRSFLLGSSSTDSNRINKLGITTTINYKGNYYIWGARNSSFPTNSGLRTFEAARRTTNFIEHSIEDSTFVCIGGKITRGYIDDILNAINSKFASWSNPSDPDKQILLGGEAYYDETLNTADTLANGHIYFPYKYCMPSVGEHITFQGILDITIMTESLADN